MKPTIVSFSQLGDRLDAPFHILRVQHGERADELEAIFSKEEAMEMLGPIKAADMAVLMPLTRRMRGAFSAESIAAVVKEYPHLCLAVLERTLGGDPSRRAAEAVRIAAEYADTVTTTLDRIRSARPGRRF